MEDSPGRGDEHEVQDEDDDDDDEWYARMEASAPGDLGDEPHQQQLPPPPLSQPGREDGEDDEAWYQALINSADASIVKGESDTVWDDLLKAMVSSSLEGCGGGGGVCDLGVEMNTSLKRLILLRHLEAGLPRTSGLLSLLLLQQRHEQQEERPGPCYNWWYVDNAVEPSVVVQTRAVGPDSCELRVSAVDATAALAVCAVALRPEWTSVTVVELDTLLETPLTDYLANRRRLELQLVKRQTLFTLKTGARLPAPVKVCLPREGMQVRLLGDRVEGEVSVGGGQYCGVFWEGKVVAYGSITAQGALSLKACEGYGQRGYERGAASQLMDWWRRRCEVLESSGALVGRPEPHALVDEGDTHLTSTLMSMGFSVLTHTVTLQARASRR